MTAKQRRCGECGQPLNMPTSQQMGRLGGLARAKNLTPRQRSSQARKAAKARWAKRSSLPSQETSK